MHIRDCDTHSSSLRIPIPEGGTSHCHEGKAGRKLFDGKGNPDFSLKTRLY